MTRLTFRRFEVLRVASRKTGLAARRFELLTVSSPIAGPLNSCSAFRSAQEYHHL